MIESSVENYLREQVNKIGGKCYKWVSPGNSGVPDRIVVFDGMVVFVETKAPNKKMRRLQKAVARILRSQGATVLSIDTKEKVNGFIDALQA